MRQNRILWCSAAVAGAMFLIGLTAVGASKPDVWRHDAADAVKDAKQSGRPLLIHFHATWCGPCRDMEREVLHHSDVRDLLSRQFVAVLADFDQNPDLVSQFDIKLLPTDVVVGPDGVVLMKSEGKRDRKSYIAQLRHALERIPPPQGSPTEPSREELVTKKDVPGTARVSEPKQEPVTEEKPVIEGKLLVGLDRYSPVSLSNHRQWRKGSTEFALVYQGVVYLLYDADEYRDFKSDPSKYAPRLLGCDPVVLWNSDRAIPGSTKYGAYFDGELFLFSSLENRDRFKSSPTLYTRPQHVLKVDQIDGPRWR